jgi:hypothetical protein
MRRSIPLFCAVVVMVPLAASAQQIPFLPEETCDKLVNEIAGDIILGRRVSPGAPRTASRGGKGCTG